MSSFTSWPEYRFLRRQVKWSGIPISWRIFHSLLWLIHTIKGFSIVNEAYIFWNFFAFSMIQWMLVIWSLVPLPFLNPVWIWKFSDHILLKPRLKDFEHDLASMWNECKCTAIETFFGIAFLWDWNENWPFPICGHHWVFWISWHIECSTFTASSFRIWNS